MMFDSDDIARLKVRLLEKGSVSALDKQGRRLFFIDSRILDDLPAGLLIVYEGQGSFFYEMDRPLNRFRLLQARFPLTVAGWLSDLVNQLTGMTNNHPSTPVQGLLCNSANGRSKEEIS